MPDSPVSIRRAMDAIISRAKEVFAQPLYDSLDFTNATVGDSRFFNQTIAGVGILRTNMELAGQLPNPRQFLIQQVSVIPWMSGALTAASVLLPLDCALLMAQASFTLTISDKPYLRGPVGFFPGGLGVEGFAATTVAATDHRAAHSGVASPHCRFEILKPGQLLKPNENFNCVVNIPTAIAGLSQSSRLYVALWGLQLRAVQ